MAISAVTIRVRWWVRPFVWVALIAMLVAAPFISRASAERIAVRIGDLVDRRGLTVDG
ncbi:hypothetical protein FHS85_002918 [Rhodoligotrophos appendicifer]|uniref:hypothetical protein n=1 Tax=Rhodoligotrophos appendicifer TaxID=987056 RepID=UPI00147974D3|nr:hypothetical protein [Rhodoligotrophos appendicifer]